MAVARLRGESRRNVFPYEMAQQFVNLRVLSLADLLLGSVPRATGMLNTRGGPGMLKNTGSRN